MYDTCVSDDTAMIQAVAAPLSFDEFITLYPNDGGRYELRHGEIVEMRPIGAHEEVIALVRRKLDLEIEKRDLPFFIPQTCLVKPLKHAEGYLPDIIVLDREAVKSEPYWKKSSSVSTGKAIRLIIEVVSTNWQDDYLIKLAEYEKLGVSEYWIIDYRGLGGVRFIGSPKTPTVWTYTLKQEGDSAEYEAGKAFRKGETVVSRAFPDLSLNVDRILNAGSL